jgi:hypothetical protein
LFVLAIYNLKGNEALLARELAAVLKRTVYEASSRLRAPGGGPSVIASFAAAGAARDAAAVLRARGFDTLLLDAGEIEADERRFVVRGFELGAEAMRLMANGANGAIGAIGANGANGANGPRLLEARYEDVELLLRGVQIVVRRPAAPRTTRKLSLARAVATAGLMVTKAVPAPHRPAEEEREGFLHLYVRGLPPLVWRETALLYRSLAGELLPSRQANFARVVAELRRRCPLAAYDERLASSAGQAQLLGPTLPAADNLDVAISVLAAALRRPAAP